MPSVNKVWLILTIISHIHSFNETEERDWGNMVAQNFRV